MKSPNFKCLLLGGLLSVVGCGPASVERLEWPVMGTIAAVQTRGATPGETAEAVRVVKGVFAEVEKLLNAHDPASELSCLAPLAEAQVLARCSPAVRPCYAQAFAWRDRTEGAFDPRWRGTNTLDLGALAKGFAVDCAATALPPGSFDVLLDLGGNLKAVRGDWQVGILGRAESFTLKAGQACATSAEYFRGKHIYDGRTHAPVSNDVKAVTVVSAEAMTADFLSTTAFILGPAVGATCLREGGALSVFWDRAAAGDTLEIAVEPGEGWWGGATVFGTEEPFALRKAEASFDLTRQCWGNQTAPLLLSTHGRYVWCDDGFRCTLKDGKFTFVSPGAKICSGRAGDSLKSAFAYASKTFFPPSGKTPDLLFVSAPQYNTWIELGLRQSQEKILAYAHKIIDNGFPPGVLMLDDTWQTDYGIWDFDPRAFPEPKKMMDELHALGFKVIVWVCPFVSMDSPAYRLLAARHGLVRDGLGQPAAIRWWDGVSAALNFDRATDRQWMKDRLDYLQKTYGVDGFKFDAGDVDFYDWAVQRLTPLADAEEGPLVRHMENWAKLGLDYPLNEYRACWKMGGQPLVQRLRDKNADFPSIAQLIADMIAAGLLGHSFVCPDMVGGGEINSFWGGTFDREAFIRSAQVHALSPMMQFSAAPWRVLAAEDFKIVQKAVALRQAFAPRFVALAQTCAVSGEPMLRSMDYQFPHEGFETVVDQFVLGDFLIVAPQIEKGATTRTVRLPCGTWRGDDGRMTVGPATLTVETPLERLPYFERCP